MTRPEAAPRPTPLVPSLVVAAVTAAGLFTMGFSGGSYDVVDRQTAAVVIWWAIGLGAVIVSPGPRRPGTAGLLVTLFAALIALWIAVNLGDSISEERSVVELGRAVTHLGPIVLIGWVLPQRYWRSVFAGLLVAAVGVLLVGFGNRLSPGFLGQEASTVFDNTRSRLANPLGYWNAIGSWAVMTSMLLLATSAHATRWYARSVSLAFVPLATAVGYMTYSRSSIGALALGLIVLWFLSKNRWTLSAHIVVAGLGSLAGVLAVRGAPQIADNTGTAGGGGVLVVVIVAGLVVGAVAAASGRFGVDAARLPSRAGKTALIATAVAGIVVAGILAGAYGNKAWDQFTTTASNDGAAPTERLTSLQGTRINQWRIALKAYDQDKLHGTGAGTFELTNNVTGSQEFVRDDHNAFIEALTEQGLPGLIVLVGLLLSIAAAIAVALARAPGALERGIIAGAAAALASFTLGTGIDWFWEVTALAMLAMTLAGIVVAASQEPRVERVLSDEAAVAGSEGSLAEPDEATAVAPAEDTDADAAERSSDAAPPAAARTQPRRTWPLRAGLVVVAVIAVLVELPGLVGTSEVRRSAQEVVAGDLTSARSHADQAIDTMPWASSPFLQRALVDEQAGAYDSSVEALHLAIRRDPQDWRLPLVLARVEAKAGHANAAIVAYRKAKSLRPGGQFFR